jgi:hypothetical protein
MDLLVLAAMDFQSVSGGAADVTGTNKSKRIRDR